MDFLDKNGNVLPVGEMGSTVVYKHIENAKRLGYKIVVEQGGSRSGKTMNTVLWLVLRMLNEKLSVIVVRGTSPTIEVSVLQDFKDVMSQLGVWKDDNYTKTTRVYEFDSGSVLRFMGCDDAEKRKGVRADIAFLNEVTDLTFEQFNQFSMRIPFIIADYNPNINDDHWIVQKLINVNCDDYTGNPNGTIENDNDIKHYFFITTYKDNPFLPKMLVDSIEMLKFTNPSYYTIYAKGLRCIMEGRMFPLLNYVEEFPTDGIQLYYGIDFGYNANPTAICKVGICQRRNEIYIEEIAYKVGLDETEIRHIIKNDRRLAGLRGVADGANPLMLNKVRCIPGTKSTDIHIKPVNKGGANGANVMKSSMQNLQMKRIFIVGESPNVRKEFESAVYKKNQSGEYSGEPSKLNADHAIDAVRYVDMTYGGKTKGRGIVINR